jgi:hypothetical protein
VDRGTENVEVMVTLLFWKIRKPDHVILIRGNHETEGVSKNPEYNTEHGSNFCKSLKVQFAPEGTPDSECDRYEIEGANPHIIIKRVRPQGLQEHAARSACGWECVCRARRATDRKKRAKKFFAILTANDNRGDAGQC